MQFLESIIFGVALGIVLVIFISIVLKLVGPLNAATRSMVWAATLAALPLLPVLHFAGHVQAPVAAAQTPAAVSTPAPLRAEAPRATVAPMPIENTRVSKPWMDMRVPGELPFMALIMYVGIVVLLLLRLMLSYVRVRRLRSQSQPAPDAVAIRLRHWLARCPTERTVELRLCDKAQSPFVIGFRQPMIVMPSALVLELSEEEFDDLGVHELAHIRRYDDWINLFQHILQAILFFHPAVYWAGRKLNFEREVACDDWVLSTNGPKSYARCLTKVVELRRCHRGMVLSSGAFFRKRQILRRVEMLLDKTRNAATGVSGLTVATVLIVLVGFTMQVAEMPSGISISRDDDGSRVKARWKDENRDLRVNISGDISFSPDDRSIAALSPSGHFEFEEVKGWSRRRIEVRPSPSGAPEEKYFVNGRQRPLDETGRAWAAATYPKLVRELGIDLDRRVGRILDARGVAGVLEEIDLIRSNDVKRRYLTRLVKHSALTTEDLQRIATSARMIPSDHDKAEFLLANIRRFATDPLRSSYFQAVDSIRSDHDRRRVLIEVLNADGHSQETASFVGRSVKSMGSDHEKSEVLLAIPPVSEEARCALLKAARSIQSDNDRARVLLRSSYLESSPCRDAFFAVVNQIQSDHDRQSVLKDVIQRNTDKAVLLQVVNSASHLSSDHSKAEVLIAAAKVSGEPEVRSAVQRASARITSDSDYRRVAGVLFPGSPEREKRDR